MSQKLRQGWSITRRHFKIIVLNFMYQAIWGIVLFRAIDHIVTPLLQRYPAVSMNADALQLFWAEIQFQLLKTDMIVPYLYALIALLALRMLLTPILQSGIYYSIHGMSSGEPHTRFRKGIAACWKPMTIIYWIKSVAIIAPFLWLIRPLFSIQANPSAVYAILQKPGWVWLLFLLWVVTISLISYLIQLGIGAQLSLLESLQKGMKHVVKVVVIGAVIVMMYGLISLSVHALSMIWISLISFILYQLLPLLRSIFNFWLVSSQYATIGHDLNSSPQ